MRINLPMQNNRYRGPIESMKIENSLLMLSHSVKQLEAGLTELKQDLDSIRLHSTTLLNKIYEKFRF